MGVGAFAVIPLLVTVKYGMRTLKKVVIDVTTSGDGRIEELSIVDVDSLNAQHWVYLLEYPRTREQTNQSILERVIRFCGYHTVLFTGSSEKCRILGQIMHRAVHCLASLGYSDTETRDRNADRFSRDVNPSGNTPENKNRPRSRCLCHDFFAPDSTCSLSRARSMALWCTENEDKIDMRRAKVRENTFVDWPTSCPPRETMAENGFVALCDEDRTATACVYCGIQMHEWKKHDDVFADHRRCAPSCLLVRHIAKLGKAGAGDMLDFRHLQYD